MPDSLIERIFKKRCSHVWAALAWGLLAGQASADTVGPTGDHANCHDAIASGAAVIEFLPGDHVGSCMLYGDRGDILITGQIGPNGERPRVTGDARPGFDVNHEFLHFNPKAPRTLTVENLEIHTSHAAIRTWNSAGLVIRNVKVTGAHDNGVTVGESVGNWPVTAEIYDSEFARSGGGNTRHNIYVHRIDTLTVNNLYSHSSRASHAFKSVARNMTITNSRFETTSLPFANLDTMTDEYLGSTLVDLAACGNITLTGNTFVGVHIGRNDRPVGWGSTTIHLIDLRRRKTGVGGCDMPAIGSAEYNDPAYWGAVSAGGFTPDNAKLFNHIIEGNTFINAGVEPLYAVSNWGTAPMLDDGASWTAGVDLPLPSGWTERSVAWLRGNTFQGAIDVARIWPPALATAPEHMPQVIQLGNPAPTVADAIKAVEDALIILRQIDDQLLKEGGDAPYRETQNPTQ